MAFTIRARASAPYTAFDIDDELWAIDGANCSPCDSKVPDSH